MAMGAPRKPLQCLWHDEARRLRAEGLTYQQIADKVGVTAAAVYFALHPDKRAEYARKKSAKDFSSAPSTPAV